jgi:hypothetical protein
MSLCLYVPLDDISLNLTQGSPNRICLYEDILIKMRKERIPHMEINIHFCAQVARYLQGR